MKEDRCELFYHQPLDSGGYLCLSYVRSGARTRLGTLFLAMLALDEIARLRNANAIVCNISNDRITDRLMQRWGWQAHCKHWPGRHYIKRFYGQYPEVLPSWRSRLNIENVEMNRLLSTTSRPE